MVDINSFKVFVVSQVFLWWNSCFYIRLLAILAVVPRLDPFYMVSLILVIRVEWVEIWEVRSRRCPSTSTVSLVLAHFTEINQNDFSILAFNSQNIVAYFGKIQIVWSWIESFLFLKSLSFWILWYSWTIIRLFLDSLVLNKTTDIQNMHTMIWYKAFLGLVEIHEISGEYNVVFMPFQFI